MDSDICLKIIKNFDECFEIQIKRNDSKSYIEQNHLLDGNLIFACNGKLIDMTNTIENNIICTTEEFFNTEFSMEVKVYVDQIVNFNFKSINKVSKIIKEIQKKLGIIKKFMKVCVEGEEFSRKCYILELCRKSIEVKLSGFNRKFSSFFTYSYENPVGKFSMMNKYNS